MGKFLPSKQQKTVLKRLQSGVSRSLLVVGFFSIIINVLGLTVPIFMLQIMDRVLPSGNLDTLLLMTVMAGCALITVAGLQFVLSGIIVRMGNWFIISSIGWLHLYRKYTKRITNFYSQNVGFGSAIFRYGIWQR